MGGAVTKGYEYVEGAERQAERRASERSYVLV